MIFKNLNRIVFAGDSVTDMGSAQPVGEGLFDNLGRSYVRVIENMLYTWYPELNFRIRIRASAVTRAATCSSAMTAMCSHSSRTMSASASE